MDTATEIHLALQHTVYRRLKYDRSKQY
jgi:hypothetical protein